MNSVSANGYQIVISTSQATARADVNIATIQVCRMWSQSTVLQNIVSVSGDIHRFLCHTVYILLYFYEVGNTFQHMFSTFMPSLIRTHA
jgi:hypothetical protein